MQQYYSQLYGVKTLNAPNVSQALCLPVAIDELLQSHKNQVCITLSLSKRGQSIIVDWLVCRR